MDAASAQSNTASSGSIAINNNPKPNGQAQSSHDLPGSNPNEAASKVGNQDLPAAQIMNASGLRIIVNVEVILMPVLSFSSSAVVLGPGSTTTSVVTIASMQSTTITRTSTISGGAGIGPQGGSIRSTSIPSMFTNSTLDTGSASVQLTTTSTTILMSPSITTDASCVSGQKTVTVTMTVCEHDS